MLSEKQGTRITGYTPDYVVFDLETTGTSPQRDSVVEIAAVKVQNREIIADFSTLVDPECDIPYEASMVHGITNDLVAQSPCFEYALQQFLQFAGNSVLVGHNIHTFDMKFLYRFSEKYWGKYPDNNYIDTLYASRHILPQLRHHTLIDLAVFYSIPDENAHRALNDCRVNQQVYENLFSRSSDSASGESICPRCGGMLVKRHGRFGDFWGCSSFPSCRYTEK